MDRDIRPPRQFMSRQSRVLREMRKTTQNPQSVTRRNAEHTYIPPWPNPIVEFRMKISGFARSVNLGNSGNKQDAYPTPVLRSSGVSGHGEPETTSRMHIPLPFPVLRTQRSIMSFADSIAIGNVAS